MGFRSKIHTILFALLILLPEISIAQTMTTIAGTVGVAGSSGDNGPAFFAQMSGPHGMAFDQAGNLYISDLGNHEIRKIAMSGSVAGTITLVAGNGTPGFSPDGTPAINAQLCAPAALVFNNSGDLYFTDRCNNRVRKISHVDSKIYTVAGTGTFGYNGDGIAASTAQLACPTDIIFDWAGNLLVSDLYNNRIRKINFSTGVISTIAGNGTTGSGGDTGLATNAELNNPMGITLDHFGNIFIAESQGHRVRKIDTASGNINTYAGTGIAGYDTNTIATLAKINRPSYLRFDLAGNLYVGDADNHRIRMIKPSGAISSIAGTGLGGYNGDGAANAKELNAPFNIIFDSSYHLYVADYLNHIIRRIDGLDWASSITTGITNSTTLEKNAAVEFKIYPNPATHYIRIQFDSSKGSTCELHVFDLLGKTVLLKNRLNSDENIDISEFAQGVYVYQINHEQSVSSGKFVKE